MAATDWDIQRVGGVGPLYRCTYVSLHCTELGLPNLELFSQLSSPSDFNQLLLVYTYMISVGETSYVVA